MTIPLSILVEVLQNVGGEAKKFTVASLVVRFRQRRVDGVVNRRLHDAPVGEYCLHSAAVAETKSDSRPTDSALTA